MIINSCVKSLFRLSYVGLNILPDHKHTLIVFIFQCKSLFFVSDLLQPLAMSHMVVHMTAQLITAKRHLFSSRWISAHRWAEELKAPKGTDTITDTVLLL